MAYTTEQTKLIKKFKKELLKNEIIKDMMNKVIGNLQDRVEIKAGLKKRNKNKVKALNDMIENLAKEKWNSDSEIQKRFNLSEDWNQALLDKLHIPPNE